MGRRSKCCKFSWFVNDGVGIGCAVFTYLLLAYAEFVVVFVMLLPEVVSAATIGSFHAIAFTFLTSLAVVAHCRAMCSDPVSNSLFILYINGKIIWLARPCSSLSARFELFILTSGRGILIVVLKLSLPITISVSLILSSSKISMELKELRIQKNNLEVD